MRPAIAVLAFAALAPCAALAADVATDAIKARQGFFKMLAANMGTLAGMAQGAVPYDEAAAVRAASNIETLTRYDLPMHFIAGTARGEAEGSNALPAIWAKPEEFVGRYAALQKAAGGIGESVKGGPDQVGRVVGALSGACKACHDDFRAK